jgi:nitrogen fixation NifU-like protein
MTDLRDLYQQVILDHNRSPKNFKTLENANRRADGDNPICGDKFTLYLRVEGDVIEDVGFQGTGCAISKASASLLTLAVKGKTREEADELFDRFHNMVTGKGEADRQTLGKLAAFGGVREFPARVKCAVLAWHALRAALESEEARASVSTEE